MYLMAIHGSIYRYSNLNSPIALQGYLHEAIDLLFITPSIFLTPPHNRGRIGARHLERVPVSGTGIPFHSLLVPPCFSPTQSKHPPTNLRIFRNLLSLSLPQHHLPLSHPPSPLTGREQTVESPIPERAHGKGRQSPSTPCPSRCFSLVTPLRQSQPRLPSPPHLLRIQSCFFSDMCEEKKRKEKKKPTARYSCC
jgi:hypothetical protein